MRNFILRLAGRQYRLTLDAFIGRPDLFYFCKLELQIPLLCLYMFALVGISRFGMEISVLSFRSKKSHSNTIKALKGRGQFKEPYP